MKNLLNFKRLWTDSHEKQSPQRFARYAAILIMLLTLGVGQIWAKTFYLLPYSEWSNDGCKYAMCYGKDGGSNTFVAMTQVTGTSWYSAEIPSSASLQDVYFMRVSSSWKVDDGWTNKYNGFGWYSYSDGDRYKGTNWDAGEKVNVGFESSENGIKYYKNSDANDTEWKFNGQNAQTTDLSTVSNLYLKEWFTYEYEGNDIWTAKDDGSHSDWTGIGATVMKYNVHRTAASAGAYTSLDKNWTSNANWDGGYKKSKAGNNSLNSGSGYNLLSGLGSGKYTMSFYYYDPVLNITSPTHSLKWTFAVPAVSGGAVTSNGTGAGTNESPYTVADGNTITFTASGSQASTDANSVLYVKWGDDEYSSTTTKTITPTTTKQSMTVKLKYYNSDDVLSGAETTLTIYYQSTISPSLDWAASDPVDPLTMVSGNDVTLKVVRANTSNAITWEYTTDDGTNWSSLTPKSTSNEGQTAVWTIPEAHGATQTYKFRAKITANSLTTEKSAGVTVYGKKTLHVKNREGWASMYLYAGDGNTGAWPGTNTSGNNGFSIAREGSSQWYTVVITSANDIFILNKGEGGDGKQTGDLPYSSYTNGNYYECYNHSGGTVDGQAIGQLYNSTAPTAPTVTASAATALTNTTATINGSISSNGNDAITDYGFYWGTSATPGTKVPKGTDDKSGAISHNLTGLTAGTTYYYQAYATNGIGETKSTPVQSFVAPYSVTITQPTGCSAITPGTGTQYVHVGDAIIATAASGYTFSSWSLSNVTLGASTTTEGVTRTSIATASNGGTIAPAYTENMTTVNLIASPTGKGTFTSSEAPVISVSAGVDTHPKVTAVPGTGYHLTGTIWSKNNEYISLSSTTTAATTITATGTTGNSTNLTASFTPNTYSIHFNGNGATSGEMSNQTDIAYDSETTITTNAFVKTGYTFAGWATAADGDVVRTNGEAHGNLSSTQDETVELYAKWTPKQSALSFDYQTSATGYGAIGSIDAVSATYDAAMPALSGSMPTAANGYAFMGFFDATGGEGTQYYDGTGASVTNWDKDTGSGTTLYAYYKKAAITELALTPATQSPDESVTATPTIEPSPVEPITVCWRLLRDNGNEITGTVFTPGSGNAVSFTAPSTSGSYKVACILRTGSVCGSGTVLDSVVSTLVVAGEHTVTVRYQDSEGRTLAASTETSAQPLEWSDGIGAPSITGYTFHHWVAGDGITIQDDKVVENTTYIKANYDGNLTAVYNKKTMLYFNNTLGWEHVYVYFYSDGNYWNSNHNNSGESAEYVFGSGANKDIQINSTKPYQNERHGAMSRIEGTNIWYFDYGNAAIPHSNYITFTKDNQHGHEYFDNTEVVRLADAAHYYDKPETMMMYVPLTSVYEIRNKHDASSTKYYTEGDWMNYPENTGYTLKIYNAKTAGVSDELQSIPFEFNGDKTMPMTVKVELNANREYGYEIHRADGNVYGNDSKVLKINDSGEEDPEGLTKDERGGIQTSVAGDYEFKLDFGNNGGYHYLIGVHYPVAANDYRIVYTDEATWSKAAHASSWYHPSRAIHKKEGSTDIVSFYVSKAPGANAGMKFQYASAIEPSTGVVTWTDVTSGTIDLSGITESGVYNFHLSQDASSISVEKIEKYTGNYYIRTDCAGNSKWENFRTSDHQMTYSEFSKDRATNTFGELYTHYYTHWCPRGTNVKFVIANDYSMCISDTLIQDVGNPFDNIYFNDEGGRPDGELKASSYDGSGNITSDETTDKYSANIRFMYDERTNKISRAYMSSATNTARKFLVLKSNTEFTNSDGSVLRGSGESAESGNYEAIFKDNEDWIYEREVKLTPSQKFKLYASYAQATAQEEGSQHFRGNYADNDWDDAANYVALIGGTGSACKARIIYDFKTNRLISAYLPDNDEAISGNPQINADIMIIREHQEAGQQIRFTTGSSLEKVKSVYGVMRFNRWILNNREHPEDHLKEHSDTDERIIEYHPLLEPGSQKSVAERGLYWISFPFDVNLSEVFGFGTYGVDWIMMSYNGEQRAIEGYWKDSEGFWEYIWDRRGVTLEKGKGYVLALELDRMQATNRTFWSNDIQQVELFFPSTTSTTGTISQTDVSVNVPAWQCNIDRRTDKSVADWDKDRRIADSHWNIIGVPSYANYGTELTDNNSETVTWNTYSKTNDLPFLYEWNANDNTYTVQSGTTYPFKAMHAYYVQYNGTLNWSLASATPVSSIVARRTYAERPQSEEFRLELLKENQLEDQTFVKLSNDEVSSNFAFGEDLAKEFNGGKANIYTVIENYLPAAGNTLPMSEQTTVVPVGVKINAAGEYTFAMPDGTEGIGVVLIDNIAGTRTNLGLMDYTVTLSQGKIDGRFALEISPVAQTPTNLDNVQGDNVQGTKVRKVMIDGILYIIKDGKVFDARGGRVE